MTKSNETSNFNALPPPPELVHVARSAGFLQLNGSDLVFSTLSDGSPIYYDYVLSCRSATNRNDAYAAYLAKLDFQTNIVEIQKFKISARKLNQLNRLISSDLTIVALSFHVWEAELTQKRVLVLLEDWMKDSYVNRPKTSDPYARAAEEEQHVLMISDAMEYVVKVADKNQIVYHIQVVKPVAEKSSQSPTSLGKGLAIMLRLMMCDQPTSLEVPEKLIRQFYSFVEPPKWMFLWCL